MKVVLKRISFLLILILVFLGCKKENYSIKEEKIYISLKDSYDRKINFSKKPKRIISLAPNITEIIFLLGEEKKLVGRTDYCDYPSEAKNIQSVGSLINPSIEKIIDLSPDLVIASIHFQKETLQILEKLNIKVYVGVILNDYEDIYKLIEDIGIILDKKEQGLQIITNMKSKIEEVKNKTKNLKKPNIYYMLSFGEDGDFTAGKDTFISYFINIAGGNNIGDEIKGWKYSKERLIERNPDIIVCSKYNNIKEQIKDSSIYKELKAVKNNKVYEIDNNILERMSPRNIEGILELVKFFHPEITNDK